MEQSKPEYLKEMHSDIVHVSVKGVCYQIGMYFCYPSEETNLFPVDMPIGGIKKIVLLARAVELGVRFRAMQRRDAMDLESLKVY